MSLLDNPKPVYWYTCFFGHKWSQWTNQTVKMFNGGYNLIETKRCIKCNKTKINHLIY